MSDEEATLVVTAGTSMYGLTELGGLVAGESVVVSGPGPIGLLGAAVAKALGAQPVILTGTRDNRLEIGKQLGADHVINVRKEDAVEAVRRLTDGKGVDYVVECSGAPNAVNEAARMLNRGGKICLAAFPSEEVPIDVAYGSQQHLPLRHSWRRQVSDPPSRGFHAAEAFRCTDHPHAHLRHGESSRGASLRQGSCRGRDQGGGEKQAIGGRRTGRRIIGPEGKYGAGWDGECRPRALRIEAIDSWEENMARELHSTNSDGEARKSIVLHWLSKLYVRSL